MRIGDIYYEHRNVRDIIIFKINTVMKRIRDITLVDGLILYIHTKLYS